MSSAGLPRRPGAVLFDIDGTLMARGVVIPGASESVRAVRDTGLPLRFLSNIDSRTPATLRTELTQAGVEAREDEIFTPVVAAIRFLGQQPQKLCHLLMAPELAALFSAHDSAGDPAGYVLVGDCRHISGYGDLNQAFRMLMAGAELLALQKGRYFIGGDGLLLDTGAFVALLEYATRQQARVFGKPTREFFQLALDSCGATPENVLVVGDDIDADIAGAREIGAMAALVRTGKFEEARMATAAAPPDAVINSIAELPHLL
jgi:HAD superfamily hydrolase (TIGR01458 family)